jgi:hypothetical protein
VQKNKSRKPEDRFNHLFAEWIEEEGCPVHNCEEDLDADVADTVTR